MIALLSIMDHQAVAAVHFHDERVRVIRSIRVNGANPVQIIGHSHAAWEQDHPAMWYMHSGKSNVHYRGNPTKSRLIVLHHDLPFKS